MGVAPLSSHDVARLLLQLALILGTARVLAELARRIGQPAVIGELLAGILLGPTVLGSIAPGTMASIFPPGEQVAFHTLEAISWVGMVLLVFLTGAETDIRALRALGRVVLIVCLCELSLSFLAGFGVGMLIPAELVVSPAKRVTGALFLATALAVTAMPVIAKILLDTGLARRDVGVVVLTAAVLDDTVGWIVLSIIAGLGEGGEGSQLTKVGQTFLFLAGFLVAAQFLLFPLVKRLTKLVDDKFTTPGSDVALYAALSFAFAALTDHLKIHAVFGAFIAGVLVRQVPRLSHGALERLEAVNGSVLAPVFFAFVGLKVDLRNVGSIELLAAVIAVAFATKLLGCAIGGRIGGLGWRASLVIGAGMSARGAMGLVVAVVGLSSSIIKPEVYSVIVLMAVATSLGAPSLLRILAARLPLTDEERARLEDASSKKILALHAPKILVPTAGGPNAVVAVALAAHIARGENATLEVLHVEREGQKSVGIDKHFEDLRRVAKEGGAGVDIRGAKSGPGLRDIAPVVVEAARGKDLLLVGASHRSHTIFEPPVESILRNAPCHAVVMCAREAPADGRFKRIIVPTDGSYLARAALEFALVYAKAVGATVNLLHVVPPRSLDVLRPDPTIERNVSGRFALNASDSLKKNLSSHVPEAAGLSVDVIEASDSPLAIVEHVRQGGFDLLVLAGHDRAIEERLFLGYGTEFIVEAAPCTTAVVIPRL